VLDQWFDGSSSIALYVRLARVFRERISEGQWKPGQKLATVEALSKQYKVARITVRQALALLAAEGLLSSSRGRGTVVARDLNLAIDDPTLRRAINDGYNVAPGQTIRVLSRHRNLRLPPLLALEAGDAGKYVRIRKTHLHNGRPFALLDSYVAQDIYDTFPRNSDQKFKIQRLLKEAGAKITVARQEVTVGHATPEVAKVLDYSMGGNLVKLRSWRFDRDHRIVYATINQYRGDLFVLDFIEEQHDSGKPLPWLIPLTRYR
jgi:GntR family transcriptional regulator